LIAIAAAIVGFALGLFTGQVGIGILVGLACLFTQAFGPKGQYTRAREKQEDKTSG